VSDGRPLKRQKVLWGWRACWNRLEEEGEGCKKGDKGGKKRSGCIKGEWKKCQR